MISRIPQSYPSPFSRIPGIFTMLHNQDDDPGSATPVKPKSVETQVQEAIAGILAARNNDPMAALETLIRKNYKLETSLSDVTRERDELKGKQPKDEDVADLAAYRELGKPADLKNRIETGEKAIKDKALGEAAEVLGLKPNALFRSLLGAEEIIVEGEGDKRTVSVKSGDKKVSFDDYAKTRPEIVDALPSLQVEQQQRQGTPFLKTAPIGGAKKESTFDRIRREAKERQEKAQQANGAERDNALAKAGIS